MVRLIKPKLPQAFVIVLVGEKLQDARNVRASVANGICEVGVVAIAALSRFLERLGDETSNGGRRKATQRIDAAAVWPNDDDVTAERASDAVKDTVQSPLAVHSHNASALSDAL